MATKSLAQKLGLKPGQEMLLLNAPAGYRERLEAAEGVAITEAPAGLYDVAQIFAADKAELDRLAPIAMAALRPEGRLWVAFPKGNAKERGLTRDVGWEDVSGDGMAMVTLIAVDERWSGMCFKRSEGSQETDPFEAQYAGAKAGLRPIYERVARVARELGDDVRLEPRRSYVTLTRTRQFGIVQASTRTRVDLGLKLPGMVPVGRLLAAGSFGSGQVTHRVALTSPADVDDEVGGWLRKAYEGVA